MEQVDKTFLDELAGYKEDVLFYDIYKGNPSSRIVHASENFTVLCDIAPLMEGHLLIIPNNPWVSFGKLSQEYWSEFTALKNRVFNVLSSIYSTPVFLEHGSCLSMTGGGCITHAHMQVIPFPLDLLQDFMDEGLQVTALNSQDQVVFWGSKDHPYLYFENIDHQIFVAEIPQGIKRQYIRIKIAKYLNIQDPYWDWGVHIEKELLRKTVATLSQVDWFSL